MADDMFSQCEAMFRDIDKQRGEMMKAFPFVVDVSRSTTGFLAMSNWLCLEIGPKAELCGGDGNWAKINMSELRFKNERDAILTKLMFG